MKAQTMRMKAYELGVLTSYSRPRVSNDNPFAESLFKTCKYRPNWPIDGFKSLDAARRWMLSFTRWYNNEHKHSQLNFVTPNQRHTGEDKEVLAKRLLTMQRAKDENPIRWGTQEVRNLRACRANDAKSCKRTTTAKITSRLIWLDGDNYLEKNSGW